MCELDIKINPRAPCDGNVVKQMLQRHQGTRRAGAIGSVTNLGSPLGKGHGDWSGCFATALGVIAAEVWRTNRLRRLVTSRP
jgi:hypothetical protein